MTSVTFVTDATHIKWAPSKGNLAPFFCTSRANLRKRDVLRETSPAAKSEEKRLFSQANIGCFMQAQRLEPRLLSFMSKYKDLYGPRNTPWILVRVCTRIPWVPETFLARFPVSVKSFSVKFFFSRLRPTAEAVSALGRQVPPHARKTSGTQGSTRTNQDMTQWTSKVRPCPCLVVVGCAMSPRSHRILLTCPFSKMADRQKTQNFDSGQKPAPLHGISLADFGGNLNFGPTLVPASQTPPVSSIIQPTATTSSSRGMNQLSTVFSP